MPGPALEPPRLTSKARPLTSPRCTSSPAPTTPPAWSTTGPPKGMTSYKAYMNISRKPNSPPPLRPPTHTTSSSPAISAPSPGLRRSPSASTTSSTAPSSPTRNLSLASSRTSALRARPASWVNVDVHGPEVTRAHPEPGLSSRRRHLHAARLRGVGPGPPAACSSACLTPCHRSRLELSHRARPRSPQFAAAPRYSQRDGLRAGILPRAAACCWPVLIPPATAACCPASATSARSSLLVEAGFTPDGSHPDRHRKRRHLPRTARTRSAPSPPASKPTSCLVKGDPSKHIADIENVETVFKDGIGYDSQKLIESVRHQVGIH